MARKAIPEKHEPEKQPYASSALTASDHVASQWRATPQQMPYDTGDGSARIDGTVHGDGSLMPSDNNGLGDLLTMFTSDPSGLIWQPSDTALGSQMESNSLPPWEPLGGADQQLDAWMPMFNGNGQHFGYS